MPEKIAAWENADLTKGFGGWCPVSPQYGAASDERFYIRADLVDDLRKALEEARERVEHWADVASRADRTRYDTSDDLAMIRTALTRIKGDVT